MKIKRIGIVANIEKEKIADHVKSLKKWLEEKGVEVFLGMEISQKMALGGGLKWNELARKSQLIVVLGGDGTMLHTARYVAGHKSPYSWNQYGQFGLPYRSQFKRNALDAGISYFREICGGKEDDA